MNYHNTKCSGFAFRVSLTCLMSELVPNPDNIYIHGFGNSSSGSVMNFP